VIVKIWDRDWSLREFLGDVAMVPLFVFLILPLLGLEWLDRRYGAQFGPPRPWFAWYPVETWLGDLVWLERVERWRDRYTQHSEYARRGTAPDRLR
jgi:hypothetical protein